MKALLAITVLGFLAAATAAQESISLADALAEARRELDAERTRIEAEQGALETELAGWVERRNAASDELVDLEIEAEQRRNDPRDEQLRDRRAELRGQIDVLQSDLDEYERIVDENRAQFGELIGRLPPSSTRPDVPVSDDLTAFLDCLHRTLQEGRTIARFDHEVTTPEGVTIAAEVLRIGEIAWAYRDRNGGGLGLAMKSPDGGPGYRWIENLRPALEPAVRAAFEGDVTGPFAFPLDVTQQLSPESRVRHETWMDTVTAGGPVMVPLAGVAALAALLIVLRAISLAGAGLGGNSLARKVFELCNQDRFDEATALCERKRTPVARILAGALGQRTRGPQAREDAVQEALLHEVPRLERFLSTIGILAAVAPLLGLLGTVTGMILTFEMIASFGSGDPRMMAGGISQALITTASGLIVAIPVLLLHSFLSARVERLIADMERHAATLLNVLSRSESGAEGDDS